MTETDASETGPRQRILDAASAEFAEHGFAGARVDEIAARARVNKAMLYYHVGDKRALYKAVLLRNFDRVSAAIAGALGDGGSPREQLERVISALTVVLREHSDHPRIVLREVASGAVHLPDDVLRRMLELVEVVRELLAAGVAAGEFRATNPLLTHLTVVGGLLFLTTVTPLRERVLALMSGRELPAADVDVAAFLADLLLNGIGCSVEAAG